MLRHIGGRLAPKYPAYTARKLLIPDDGFPLLDFKELSQRAQECDFDASVELLMRPSGPFMRKLFEQILDTFIGLSPDDCMATTKTLLKHINPALLQDVGLAAGDAESDDTADTVGVIVLYRAVNMFLQKCGIQDFKLMNLIRPDALCTQRILSGVINFARFREEHLRECEHLARELEDAVLDIHHIEDQNVDLQNRIDKLSSRLRGEIEGGQGETLLQKRQILQWHKYNSKLERELIKLHKSQEFFKKEHMSYKETKTRLIKNREDHDFLLSESERELRKIEGYASADPAILRQVVADLKQHSQTAEEDLRGLESPVRNKTRTLQSIQIVEDELRVLMKILQETTNDLKMLEYANENHTRQIDELTSKQQTSEELAKHLERGKRQLRISEEKIPRMRQQALEMEHSANERFQALEHEYNFLTNERYVKQERLDRARKANNEIEADIHKTQLEFDLEKRSTESAVAKLNAHIR